MSQPAPRPVFSGHESFQCRALWLKKGLDFVENGGSFAAESAVVDLGVGKNMVGAIRFWLRAFGLLEGDKPTVFSQKMLSDDGFDPFLEDELTLWLLHHRLVKTGHAAAYSLIFNELRRRQIEFAEKHFVQLVEEKSRAGWPFQFNANTAKADFEVFCKMYLAADSARDREELLSGLLTELRLLAPATRSDKKAAFQILDSERDELPDIALLFALLDDERIDTSVNFEAVALGPNSPGTIFSINRNGLLQKIERLAERFDWLIFSENAGVRELQFRQKPDPFELLKTHYK